MDLAVYKISLQGLLTNREIRKFDAFPGKEFCKKKAIVVAHPIDEYVINLHKNKNYRPPAPVDYDSEEDEDLD